MMWREAEDFLVKDKYLGPLVSQYGPCKIKKRPQSAYFADLVDSICGQQLSVKAAATISSRVTAKLKKVTPKTILAASEDSLRNCGLSWAKVSYIKDLAAKTQAGEVKIRNLDNLSDDEIRRELVAVKGIGKWTADMFLMFALARPDIFPIEDLGIRNAVKKLLEKDLANEEMVKLAEAWHPFRTVASWYLWRSLENTPLKTVAKPKKD